MSWGFPQGGTAGLRFRADQLHQLALCGLALEGAEVNTDWESTSGEPVLRVVTGGFQVFYDYDEEVFSNSDRDRYHYLALR